MTAPKPFRVEVAVAAPPEEVWSALTRPEEIRQWFGWEHEGLDDEIRYILVDHAGPAGSSSPPPTNRWTAARPARSA